MFEALRIFGWHSLLLSTLLGAGIFVFILYQDRRHRRRSEETHSSPSLAITRIYGNSVRAGSYRR